MTKIVDLYYINNGLFTRFVANTTAGECAYNTIAEVNNGTGSVLSTHLKSILSQLKKAGYIVGKQPKSTLTLNDILGDM